MRALDGIRVIDLTRFLSGPYCTMLLADMGAEVIKVETPKMGDDFRFFWPFQNKESGTFMCTNRNKKSVTLNLTSEKGKRLLAELVKQADVFVENFSPGTTAKLGFDYDSVKRIRPDIVYASISGFGQDGPHSKRPAYDLIIQAASGLMSMTGYPDRPPVRVGTSITDILAGMFCAYSVVTALIHRSRTGRGQQIDISMFDAGFSVLENAVARVTMANDVPTPMGVRHSSGGPHNIYRTTDGYVVIATGNPGQWKRLCQVMGRPGLGEDPNFDSMAKRKAAIEFVDSVVEEWTSAHSTDEVVNALEEVSVPCGPVLTADKVVEHPQLKWRNMLARVLHPTAGWVTLPNSNIKMSETPGELYAAPPTLGQHNVEVYSRLAGLSENDIATLAAEGVI
ncbi:MAG: CoA transferase [Firmicutes bacterium]|nr:CoA transferase [Bacillota bacterium]